MPRKLSFQRLEARANQSVRVAVSASMWIAAFVAGSCGGCFVWQGVDPGLYRDSPPALFVGLGAYLLTLAATLGLAGWHLFRGKRPGEAVFVLVLLLLGVFILGGWMLFGSAALVASVILLVLVLATRRHWV